ncbi:hypothetical protein F5X68DRAFT_73720 [Plectosphaerella plurivora]|uniref:DUF4048 domain-containing protein n=1 Tax=Plectosphaerella plurivora TaxID=936078 RepID=A0A9P9ABV6_9PEZI|nr:hypothetical protein F5X68DRAFT_73720 [Plectosphaerella plurivora]
MTAIFLLQICSISSCSNILLHDHQKHLNSYKAFVARRTNHPHSSSPGRYRHNRRVHTQTAHSLKRRRFSDSICSAANFTHHPPSKRLLTVSKMQSAQHIRRRSSIVARTSSELSAANAAAADATAMHAAIATATATAPSLPPRPCHFSVHEAQMQLEGKTPAPAAADESMPPPPPPEDFTFGRLSRSTSSASRNTHRLSLTLPIAPPTSDPSRPPSTVLSSYPATPVDSTVTSPVEASEFIIAIAAQERKVLEIREELARAEGDLDKLKKQWAVQEAYQKRNAARTIEPYRPRGPQLDKATVDDAAVRRSIDIDRKKAMLLSGQNTPKEGRRRVMRGGHTRTLSLLSPMKPDTPFSVHEDMDTLINLETAPSTPMSSRASMTPTSMMLNKRASWQPRAYQPNQQGVKQIAEDLRTGLWNFMEDIRQATVGDEPINGHPATPGHPVTPNMNDKPVRRQRPMSIAGDQDTIRASASRTAKAPLSGAFEPPVSLIDTPIQATSPTQERPTLKPKGKAKHFSWQPLTLDSLDDNDWSNWESPSTSSAKSARWSGSTVGTGEGIAPIPERADEHETPLKKKSSRASIKIDTKTERITDVLGTPILSPTKLEEILPNMVNKLSPSNIKRTANDLLNEWERSLTPPQKERAERAEAMKENHV